jgi:type II secretory pathway pseudopilin PulG
MTVQGLKKAKKTRGFTLAEILVGTVCGFILLSALILFLRSGMSFFRAEEGRTSALQGLLLTYDMIQDDVRSSLYYPEQELNDLVKISTDAKGNCKLTLTVLESEKEPVIPYGRPEVTGKVIEFSLAPAKKEGVYHLKRSEGGEDQLYKSVRIRGLYFEHEKTMLEKEGAISLLNMFVRVYSTNKEFDKLVFPFVFMLEPETYYLRNPSWHSGF